MTENFISNIYVKNSRKITNLEIPLSPEFRQHLILTGKNGSGKTSLLLELNKFLSQIDNGNFQSFTNHTEHLKNLKIQYESATTNEQKLNLERNIKDYESWFLSFGGVEIKFSNSDNIIYEKCINGEFLLAYFDAKRHTNLLIPSGINKIEIKKKYNFGEKANTNFIQYIVNLKADRSFARDDNENDVVEKIDLWFINLENRLKTIFNVKNLELRFDRKTYNFDILTDNENPINFNTLSDGYSAILSIVTELLLRMEAHNAKTYDLEGIVIIDEIETHLHIDLQKKILPFLIDFFPKIQFIVTTHSPFVLSSLSNTIICDLETRTITNDLTNYSYDALIESYFKTDKYSEEVKQKILEFEELILMNQTSFEQKEKLKYLRNYFAHSPKYLSKELLVKLQQLDLIELNKK